MTYIIKRDDGAYVSDMSKSGGASYTRLLQHARTFQSREQAEQDLCPENETITTLDAEMGVWR